MVEAIENRGCMPESIRQRPMRIANRLLQCDYWPSVALFYADELKDVSPATLFDKKFSELTPEEKAKLRLAARDKFSQLIRAGDIDPEAFKHSCSMVPPVSSRMSMQEEFHEIEKPFFPIVLNRYIPQTTFRAEGTPSVLSLACGQDREADAIHDYFSSEPIDGIHVGIDMNDDSIRDAQVLYRDKPNYRFIVGNLDSEEVKSQIEQVQPKFDIVVMRHFPVLPGGDLWQRTLKDYARFLRQGGLLMMTLYYPEEFETLIDRGFSDCYQVEVSERNKARAFNKRLLNKVRNEMLLGAMTMVFSSNSTKPQFDDVLDNVYRQDQFVLLAAKK